MGLIILLLSVGTILVFLEIVLPGGIWAFAGVAFYIWAAYEGYASCGVLGGVAAGLVAFAMCVLAFLVWLKILPKTSFGKKMYLNSSEKGTAMTESLKGLIGKEGVALTVLMPSGKVAVDGVPYDAKSEAAHIEKGASVMVIGADSFEIKVKKS